MADITAKMVNELRAKTGQGMMECKKALGETAGDVEKAVDWFRKKGVKTSILNREAREGRISVVISPDARAAAAVEVLCNTDFTAKSEPIIQLAGQAAQILLRNAAAKPADDPAIKERLTQASQTTGENVQLGRTAVLSTTGKIGSYTHHTGKVGVLAAVSGNATDELLKDLCLHIAASKPLALSREQVPADIVAREKDIAVEAAKGMGKPQEIAEKIAEGKMRTFYEERVLLDQKFVKDASKTISQLVQSAGAKLEGYVRLEIGQ